MSQLGHISRIAASLFTVAAVLMTHISYAMVSYAMAAGGQHDNDSRPTASLYFEHTEYDFGEIDEQAGKVSHAFPFTNGGTAPIAIVSAATSCGCTVAAYPRKPVMPSESSNIEVSFDPADRPGRFEKAVTVTTSERGTVRLRITGVVRPRKRTTEEMYPVYIGCGLRLEDNFHSFSYIAHGRPYRTVIGMVNTSEKPLQLHVDGGRVYTTEYPTVLAAGQRAEIVIACDVPRGSGIYGTVTETLRLTVNGRRSDAEVTVTGIATDNGDDMDEISAPKAVINKNIIKFGVAKRNGEALHDTFEIANEGGSTLYIRAIEGLTSGTTLSSTAGEAIAPGEAIAAGQKLTVTVTLEPRKREYGPSVERIRFIFNDPARPMREVKVTSAVSE